MRAAPSGTFVLRCVETDAEAAGTGVTMDLVNTLMARGNVLTAVEAAASGDPRERGVALRFLKESLDRFRAND